LQSELAKLKDQLKAAHSTAASTSNQDKALAEAEEWKRKYNDLEKRIAGGGGAAEQIEQLQAEVAKWQSSAAQLEQLGTEAVQEVYAELERERKDKADLQQKLEDEKQKREKAEEEVAVSEQKLQQLDGVMKRLLQVKKG
jgi:predicted  nucleic acid-binding Zn-ribbon protein